MSYLCQLNCELELQSEKQPNCELVVWNKDLSRSNNHRKEILMLVTVKSTAKIGNHLTKAVNDLSVASMV